MAWPAAGELRYSKESTALRPKAEAQHQLREGPGAASREGGRWAP